MRQAIEFSLLTGVRLSNCVNLDWSQVDMTARTLTFKVKSNKPGGKPHQLPMSEQLFILLANMDPQDKGRVFLYRGKPIVKFRTAWKAALRRAEIDDFRWHDLRHMAATWMVNSGVPLDVVQEALGHEDIQTTQRYAHWNTDAVADALNKLAAEFGQSQNDKDDQVLDMKGKFRGRA